MQERNRKGSKALDPIQDNLYNAGLEFITACRSSDAVRKQLSYKIFLQLFMQRWQIDGLPLPSEESLPTEQLEVLDIVYDTQLLDWISSCCQVLEKKRRTTLPGA